MKQTNTNDIIYKYRTLTGIKNAILKHKKVWITPDDKHYIYAVLKKNGDVWINFGLTDETASLHDAMIRIDDFLSFQRSIGLLGGN